MGDCDSRVHYRIYLDYGEDMEIQLMKCFSQLLGDLRDHSDYTEEAESRAMKWFFEMQTETLANRKYREDK